MKRRVYQATLSKLQNSDNLISKRRVDSQNNYNVHNFNTVENSVILPIAGKFTRIAHVSRSSYFPVVLAPHTSTHVKSPLQVDHQPQVVSTHTLGSVDTWCESFPFTTQNLGSVVKGRESPVPTQTLASVGIPLPIGGH